ncbi:MAG: hypothetical protein Q7T89_03630 [Anaerolineales bacterium]|nr:hypothetical protein [Anaerolineales bacterium]
MKTDKYSIMFTEYEYSLLKENSMISMLCERQLKSATKYDEEVELSLTLDELNDLIGHIAAESNHSRSKRKGEDLGEICDYLESVEFDLRRNSK